MRSFTETTVYQIKINDDNSQVLSEQFSMYFDYRV